MTNDLVKCPNCGQLWSGQLTAHPCQSRVFQPNFYTDQEAQLSRLREALTKIASIDRERAAMMGVLAVAEAVNIAKAALLLSLKDAEGEKCQHIGAPFRGDCPQCDRELP